MLYAEFVNKAVKLTIVESENGVFYLEPLWKTILISNELDVSDISDVETTWDEVSDVLKLSVEKFNTLNSKRNNVINWLYDLIMSQVEPAILQEETDYMKQVVEFMKANHATQEDKDWDKFKKV